MSLNIYPSKVGDTTTLKVTYLNELGETVEGSTTLNVSAPNLRTTENSDDHLFLRSTNNLFLCHTFKRQVGINTISGIPSTTVLPGKPWTPDEKKTGIDTISGIPEVQEV